jgi:phosphate:Na+ symporter
MFNTFLTVFHNPDKKMGSSVEKVRGMETLSDQMQVEITKYLVECSKEDLSERSVMNINAIMRIVNELENIGDSCYKLMLLTERKYNNKIQLHTKAMEEFDDFTSILVESMELYKLHMNEHLEKQVLDIVYKLEKKMNNLRDNLKKATQYRLQEGSNVKSELLYLDLLKHFEHIGDNNLNIAQALRQVY